LTTPSSTIIANSQRTFEILDDLGRKLIVRHINALDRLRLLKAAGPELSDNDAWLNMAALALSVVEMNGIPCPMPTNERQIEAAVSTLGDPGLQAVADALAQNESAALLLDGPPGGNVVGTPN
jgi:hypothetical protein